MLSPQERTQRIHEWRAHYNDKLKDIGFEAPRCPRPDNPWAAIVAMPHRPLLIVCCRSLTHLQRCRGSLWMDFDVYKNFEGQLLQHAVVEYLNPLNVPKGEMREIKKRLPNGQEVIEFVGQDNFCRFLNRPGRRVVSFRTDQGPVSASGMFLR